MEAADKFKDRSTLSGPGIVALNGYILAHVDLGYLTSEKGTEIWQNIIMEEAQRDKLEKGKR